jgi:fatty-acyl-CoA synthase
LIKSGGEWISSVEIENHLLALPVVADAAVIAVPHPRFSERPLALIVLRAGASVPTKAALKEYLEKHVAKWY